MKILVMLEFNWDLASGTFFQTEEDKVMSGLLKTEIQSRKYIYNLIYILRFQIALVLFASMNRVGSNCRVYKGGKTIPADPNLDYAANYAHMLGYKDQKFHELMRLYITIHRSIFKICIQYSSCEMWFFFIVMEEIKLLNAQLSGVQIIRLCCSMSDWFKSNVTFHGTVITKAGTWVRILCIW